MPMDRSHVREIVDESIRPLRSALGLQQWTIHVVYEALEEGTRGLCHADPKYYEATIRLDPEQIDHAAGVLDVLRHEMLHIVHAEFQTYRRQVSELIGEAERRALDHGFDRACEDIVHRLSYMLDTCLRFSTKRLIGRGRRLLEE